ncbi:YdeI/OmpD-associated family protein [bacterium]|nr:YdeI/OmpD-associated family protein [bacterium]
MSDNEPRPAPSVAKSGLPVRAFTSAKTWETWLSKNHDKSPGLWLKFAKKDSGAKSVAKTDAIDIALAWGWIDGHLSGYDDAWFLTKFTPRRAKSGWSKVNTRRVQALIDAGKMREPGLAHVEAAKADGRWDAAYDSQSTAQIPPELAVALKKNKKAAAFYATLKSANRYAIFYRLTTAKKPETRAARLEKIVAMLERGEKFHLV